MNMILYFYFTHQMRNFMKEKYGGIDVLVNNAAIAFSSDATEPMAVQASVARWQNLKPSLDCASEESRGRNRRKEGGQILQHSVVEP